MNSRFTVARAFWVVVLGLSGPALADQLAFTHVTVIDTASGRSSPDMTVVVSGDRITSAGPSRRMKPRRGDRVVDDREKSLIPGLWDMHVHIHATLEMDARDTSGQTWFAPHFAANGITGVRSMFDSLAAIEKLRADIAAGRVVGPRIVTSGPILDGERPFWPGSIACANAEQGRAAVERLKREGSDFVKVYDGLPRDAYFAIAEEANRVGLPFAGHLPNSVTIEEASDAGQKSIEHLPGMGERADAILFAKFVKNGTWMTPTLTVLRSVAYFGDPAFMNDDRLRYVPPAILLFWQAGGTGMGGGDAAARKQRFERKLQLVGAMHRAGVKILAGTDTPNPYVFPGSGLHDSSNCW